MKKILSILYFFFPVFSMFGQNVVVNTTPNTACNGLPCDWQGPSILINEIMVSPSVGDGTLSGTNGPNAGKGEWIELYNPDVCNPIDISCYYLGNFTNDPPPNNNPGGYRLPNNLIVPPAGFVLLRGALAQPVPANLLVQNGGNTIEIVVPPNITDQGICVGGGGNRLWFPNAGGWFAFYDANGVPQDAIRWGPGNVNSLNGQPCLPSVPGCTVATSLQSYNQIPAANKTYASTLDAGDHIGQSLRRIPDGGAWQGPAAPTYGTCNAPCFDPAISECLGTATVVSAPGIPPYTYLWNDQNAQTTQTATGLCSQEYSVTVTSSNGIVSTVNFTIEDYVPPVNFNWQESFCIDDPATAIQSFIPVPIINEEGIFTGPGVNQNQFNPATAGAGTHVINYEFTDVWGCTNSDETTVVVHPLPVLNITLPQQICIDAAAINIQTNPIGGVISGPGVVGNQFNPSVADVGTHQIIYNYTDGNGCANTTTTNITVNPLPTITFNTANQFCIDDDPVNLSATPIGGQFTFNSAPLTQINPALFGTGTHIVNYAVTDLNGCSNNANLNITVHNLPSVTFNINDNLCLNSPFYEFTDLALSPQPGTTIFSGPGVVNNGILASTAGLGIHTINLLYTDLNGCQNTASAQVQVYGTPQLEISNNQEQYCISDSITDYIFTPNGGVLYGPATNGFQFLPYLNNAGNYNLYYVYMDENNCSDTLNFGVEVMPLPFVNILSQTIYCINDEPSIINTIPQTGGTLTLNGAPTNTIDPNQLGVGVHELYFSYTSNIGCSNEITRLLYVAPNPEIELSLQPISSCPPLIYAFFGEALNGGFCSWDFGNGDITEGCAPISQTYNQTGCYSPIYSVSNEFGCASDTTLSDLICVYIVPEAQFYYTPNPLTIFNNTANFINTSNNGVIYHWEFSVNNNLISTNQTDFSFTFPDDIATFYPVTLWAESVDGCIDSVTYDVIVNPDINLYVPNTFTPDNDKFNDEWFIFINGIDIYDFELVVFNRWGEIVWESRNPNKGWNGTYNGQPVPEGTYVWQISAKQLFIDKRHAWRGHLNVLR